MEIETHISETSDGDVELKIVPRRITMKDGRYMIFFTFRKPDGEDSADKESDV